MTKTKDQLAAYRRSFAAQKSNAKKRGIEFMLTFNQWLEWWGDDIDKRGSHRDGLQMQRYGDIGPYALGNIKKGTPRQNSATWAKAVRNRKADKAKREHEAFLDALMHAESKEDRDEWIPDDEYAPIEKNGLIHGSAFIIDRRP